MLINIFRTSVVVFWLAMMSWLVRYEAFPEKFTDIAGGYRALLQSGPLILDSWMLIESQGIPVGYSHTWLDTNLDYDRAAYALRNQTAMNLNLMGQVHYFGVNADAVLDDQYRLQQFSAMLTSDVYSTRVSARRLKNDVFEVVVKTRASERSYQVKIPDDVVLYSSMSEMALKRIEPGEVIRFKTIDPLSLNISEVAIEAAGRETLVHEGKSLETILLNINYRGMAVRAWIDAEGRVLREETPFGWVMRASSAREILNRRRRAAESPDLFASMAVPVKGTIVEPRRSRWLKLRLIGQMAGLDRIADHRQKVIERKADSAVLEVSAQNAPAGAPALGAGIPADAREHLFPSAAIQCDHPEIMARAREIVSGAENSYAAALAINNWVHLNLVKNATVSLPSALDVLRSREGDCNEHTYLFVALARAAGLPARINVGIVYADASQLPPGMDGRHSAFYYHAWPSVFTGEWVDMDPTLGGPLVDAAYVTLASGELDDQMRLLGVFGRLSVDVLAQK